MAYYIKYPKNHEKKVSVVSKKPRPSKVYGFAEGAFKTKKQVAIRLNWMNIPSQKRPAKFRGGV